MEKLAKIIFLQIGLGEEQLLMLTEVKLFVLYGN